MTGDKRLGWKGEKLFCIIPYQEPLFWETNDRTIKISLWLFYRFPV